MNKLLNLQGKLDLERIKNLFPKSYFLLNQINESRKGTGSPQTVRIWGQTEIALIRFDQITLYRGDGRQKYLGGPAIKDFERLQCWIEPPLY